jgi:flagellar biosynthesis GTPase FlhF
MAIAFMDYMIALRASGLPGPTRSVALWVATRCANGWPVTIETIAMDSGFSVATVKRHLSILETSRWLSRQTDRNKGNRYDLQIPASSLAQSEPTDSSERANGMAQSELSNPNGWLRVSQRIAQSEPTDGSERANRMAQSEPTYIRTIQEHKNNKNLTCARTLAREGDAATIKHSNLNEGLLARWVRELVKVPEAKEEILKLSFQKSPGEVYQAMFVTSLYTSEALFERFRPWFVRLQSEGRL